jgi:hypothetical protein
MRTIGWLACLVALMGFSCGTGGGSADDDTSTGGTDTWPSGDTDTDTDADTDADADTDTDTDADGDSDSDLDGGPDGGDDGGPSTDECVDEDSDWWCAGLDCNDSDPAINPGTPEVQNNGLDDDCDGETDEIGCQESDCDDPCSNFMLGKSYIGCEYYPTVTVNAALDISGGGFHFAVAVSNTSSDPANVTVTIGTSTVATQQVAVNSVAVITLPWTDLRTSVSNTVLVPDGAYHLVSDRPVTVYQFNPLEYTDGTAYTYTNDASLLLPVNTWGTSYAVASRNTWMFSGSPYPGFYAVVARDDNTTVTITPSATGAATRPGGGLTANSGSVVLGSGDVLQVLSGKAATDDLTGTMLNADKPIQVIGGHDCTYVPKGTPACDHLEESMFPTSTLATEYIVSPPSLPNLAQPKVFRVRIIAIEPGTTLQYDPPDPTFPTGLANPGDYVEIYSTADFKITASQRVLVSQYMTGQGNGAAGDPAMALAVASHQFRTSYLFHAPLNYSSNYVNIIAPATASVTLDGNAVTGWTAVGSTGYSISRVAFTSAGDGNHHVEADAKVGITVYGYGSYTSYWYPGGLNLLDVW